MGEERTATVTPTSRRAAILVYWDDHVETHRLPDSGAITIGRSKECDITIDHASVSRKHLAIHVGDEIRAEDLGSSNGTRLAGRRLAPNQPEVLPSGALLEVGLATVIVQGTAALPERFETHAASSAEEPTMNRILRLVDLVAASDISVLLLGETGVGKEVMAEKIHAASPRASKPLVRLNCAAMPENLLESELFGHERGAFTGAQASKPGLVETADGGTLFLDEVGEMPVATQAKMLRVLESREVQRVGALQPRPVDVRFISATNADLEGRVAAGTFRRDLFYRLNGIAIAIPPLRQRTDEIPKLARQFLRGATIAPAAMEALQKHDWPGNIRELRNAIERALVLAAGRTIGVEHLPAFSSTAHPTAAPRAELRSEIEAIERQRIVEALERSAGNQTEAAKLLGISRRMLVGRLDAYGLPRPRKKT